ncbi:hypothetical protein [Frigoribacterium sp. CG_9.8]|uniref:hypothetical protein n=1 Tax=Frigoribacterium sp. CG_9.8 TaxID=2787733 RepID=UPI0018C99194|nr:hypothetical protein [Frigoribacterium sp. CG_9.8]MBG6106616.1 hypothetical protein [Frigoribacterium sp. CG_9.8]
MSVELIAQKILADNFGQRAEEVDIRQLLEQAARLGENEGSSFEAAKVCLCPEWLPREEYPHVYDYCPFYCSDCNYDSHRCRGCGEELQHSDLGGHFAQHKEDGDFE